VTAGVRSPAYVVGVLSLGFLLAIVDRMVLSLLVEPIKIDLELTDTEMGLLAGIAFGLFYTVMGIPLGRLADRVHRPFLIAAGLILRSLATMLCGFTASFAQLFIMRVLVGVGEASLSPAAYSLIADYVPRPRLGRALSVYMLGTVVGLGVAWIAGGQILRWMGGLGGLDLPLLADRAPWQIVFVLVGLPGLIVAPLILKIREPRDSRETDRPEPSKAASLRAVWNELRANRRLYLSHFTGMAAVNTYGFALLSWAPAMFHRDFGWSLGRAGTVLGVGVLLVGTLGMLASGHIADRFGRKGIEDAPFRILFVGTLAMVPVGVLGPLAGTAWGSAALFVVPVLGLFFAVVACAPTVLQIASPIAMRSSISAIYLFVVNIVAYALGPLSVGLVSDHLPSSDGSLATALLIIAVLSLPAGALAFRAGIAPFSQIVLARRS
jgi:MFS family permease